MKAVRLERTYQESRIEDEPILGPVSGPAQRHHPAADVLGARARLAPPAQREVARGTLLPHREPLSFVVVAAASRPRRGSPIR
jgi:hypothetical protein